MAGGVRALSAQSTTVSGRVLRGGAPPRPFAHTWVVLHRIALEGGGEPVDSTRTDAEGRFRLAIRRPDSTAVYVVSTWYAGIAYFSEPISGGRARDAALRPIYAYDTSSTGPPVRLAQRVVMIARRQRDGARAVLELLHLENPTTRTRIAPDTLQPTWTGALPPAAIQFQAGQGDLSPQAVTVRGDSVAVFGPIPPGEAKQLSYQYVLPADRRDVILPIDQPTSEVELLLEDTSAVVRAAPLDSLGVEDIDGRRFARYRLRDVPRGTPLAIVLPPPGFRPQMLVPIVIGGAALVLGVAFVVALRRRPAPLAPPEVTP